MVAFPSEILTLTSLTLLNVASNKIQSIPEKITQLANLVELDLSDNHIDSLPHELRALTNLQRLNLTNNPLPIPPEIIEKINEPQTILSYYFSLTTGKKKPLGETKILVVGQGSVGKTSLIQRIIHNNFKPEDKTEGIAISQWEVNGKTVTSDAKAKIELNLWDFGGQEIMHATHQFFLTRRSLYLLILDSRLKQEENRVEYWLKMIQSFGGDSPVLIVGNKTDQHPLDIDRTGLQNKYPNIVGILETSAATGQGISELRSAISMQVDLLPHVHDLLPETWFTIKARLENIKHDKNYFSQNEYVDLCNEYEVTEELDQRALIGFLHDLGVVIYFQDDPRLEALGILNPEWVTNGVYKILNSHILFQSKGVLTSLLLNEILNLDEYPRDKRLFIVDMMKKFELCYEIDNSQFLVTDLLPKDEPFTGDWLNALAFQYHYDVLPSSIISRFIVRMNAFIHKTVWRSGVVLKNGENTALIKADAEDRKIYILVGGNKTTCRDFLSMIRGEFESIHRTIAKIEATAKVPHPQDIDLVFDYKELLQFERDGILEFPKSFQDKTIMVNVRQLLDGVADPNKRRQDLKNARQIELVSVSTSSSMPALVKQFTSSEKKNFLTLIPQVIGRFFLDIFGRDKATDLTAIILGYLVITITIGVAFGIINLEVVINWFKYNWRFFFPEPK